MPQEFLHELGPVDFIFHPAEGKRLYELLVKEIMRKSQFDPADPIEAHHLLGREL